MRRHPSYLGVFSTFVRNSLVRDMIFRTNFIIETIASLAWMAMNLGFYILIFTLTPMIGEGSGWAKMPFFVFLGTTYMVNSLVQALFMPNAEEFSELIRTGGLDSALVKPIDTQFLVSLHRISWSSFANFFFGLTLLSYALSRMAYVPGPVEVLLYPFYLLCGVAIMYSLMISLAAMSVWLGRNQSLYNFWFYITTFSRYPMEIYRGPWGTPLQLTFTYLIPILVVVNVPARLLIKPLNDGQWELACYAVLATLSMLLGSRWVFQRALLSYRSASS